MRYICALLITLNSLAAQISGEGLQGAQALLPLAWKRIEVPRRLTLDVAQEILLQNNLAVIAARYGVDIARAQRLAASLRPNPMLTLGSEQFDFFKRPLHMLSTNPDAAANRLYTLRFDQLIERGNKRKLRVEAAELQLKAAEAQVLDTIRQQMFQLRQAFYAAVLARENMRVAEENLRLIDNTERLIRVRVDAGDLAEWELIRFQANKVQFQRDLASSRLAYQQSVLDLLNLLGVQPSDIAEAVAADDPEQASSVGSPVDVVGDLNVRLLTVSLAELKKLAMENRPDVIAAQRNLEAAQRALDLAYALRHRDVDLAWEYQRNGSDNTFGVVISIPLFLFNRHQGAISQAMAQLEQAKAQLVRARLQAMTDVEKAYQAYQLSQQMMRVYTAETLARAEESFRIAMASYSEGAASLLDVLDAQRTYNQTRVAYNQVRFDYLMSLYQMELAAGKSLVRGGGIDP